MLTDVVHLCAVFAMLMGGVYFCAMRGCWLTLTAAALLIAFL